MTYALLDAFVAMAPSPSNAMTPPSRTRVSALQPSFMVAEDLRTGDRVEILPEYQSVELGIYVVYPTRKHLATKVRMLINYLAERFAHPQWEQ